MIKYWKRALQKQYKKKKLKIAGQPKIDLKTFGEGKDLNCEIKLELIADIKLQSFNKFKVSDFSIKVDKKEVDERLDSLAKEYKSFEDKPSSLKSVMGYQIIFDYDATVDGKEFEGSKG